LVVSAELDGDDGEGHLGAEPAEDGVALAEGELAIALGPTLALSGKRRTNLRRRTSG
jgi:hypothetical protein